MSSWCNIIIVFIDRYYFPIINFGVVKVPQLFIMMISIRVTVMFRKNRKTLQKTAVFTKQKLEEFFYQLMDIIKVLNLLEMCFNKLTLAIVTTSLIKIIFTSYGTFRELFNGETTSSRGNMGLMSMIKDMEHNDNTDDKFVSFLMLFNSTCTVFGVVMNVFWTIIFLIPCIVCNELSRSSLSVITSKLAYDDAKPIVRLHKNFIMLIL